ncbi:MAG: hypothetical protein ACYTAO_17640, partial [Planctomycetota bacterium]
WSSGKYLLTHGRGEVSFALQHSAGDILARKDGKLVAIELKVEQGDKWGNFFLETWSNRQRFTTGWMFPPKLDYRTRPDFLWYMFLDEHRLYSIDFAKLWDWAFRKPSATIAGGTGRLFDFRERLQGKTTQRNDTWGRAVPIDVIRNEIGFRFEETLPSVPPTNGVAVAATVGD